MSEEKPFEPTQRRLKKARQEGNVARSGELNTVIGFAAAVVGASAMFPSLRQVYRGWLAACVAGENPLPYAAGVGTIVAVPMIAGALGATLCSLIQTAGPISKPLRADFSKLNPGEGFKRIFSLETTLGVARALVGLLVAGATIVPAIRFTLTNEVGTTDVLSIAATVQNAVQSSLAGLIGVAAIFAGFDLVLVRRQRLKKLRMTLEELKREMRDTMGDPLVRSRRRSLAKKSARRAASRVREASFVVANPEHVLIGLRYAPPEVAVPVVVVSLLDDEAAYAKSIARSLDIPIIENVVLARALFAKAVVDEPIPDEFFGSVAAIVAAMSEV